MNPVIHEEAPNPILRPVRLKLRSGESEDGIRVVAVNEAGSEVCTIIAFGGICGGAWSSAKQCLEKSGYDISWADWDVGGRIILEKK